MSYFIALENIIIQFMNLLAIVGPTAVGKTRLAVEIKKELDSRFHGNDRTRAELVSVDSRQVYIGMDIGTGKDAKIFGTDLTKPNKLFNVADYCHTVKPYIQKLLNNGKLPILVGGTGLYLKALIDGFETLEIPPNTVLRKKLEKLTIVELQKELLSMYPYMNNNYEKGGEVVGMNNSDWNNPRRLIRRIEIEKYKFIPLCHSRPATECGVNSSGNLKSKESDSSLRWNDIVIIGLTAPLPTIKQNIERRVKERLDKGLFDEIKSLVDKYGWNEVLRNTIAYKEWEDYFSRKITKEAAIENWIKDEFNYAKRQLTWFKKDRRIVWRENDYFNEVLKLINLA